MGMSETKKHIPHGWDSQPIGALVTEQLKSTIKVSEASGFGAYPFFTSGDDILVHSQPLIDGKTIFLATGGQANVKYYDGDAAYSTDTYALKSNGQIAAKLLFYDLDTMASYIDGHYFQGSGLKHLQKKDLKRHELCFPKDMGEQQRIVRLLTCLDEAIAKTEALIEKYRRIKQGMMHDLLTYGIDKEGNIRSPKTHRFKPSPLGMIPEEWKCVELSSIIQAIDPQPDHRTPAEDLHGVPYIGISDVTESGKLDLKKCRKVGFHVLEKQELSFRIDKGDIIFGKIGTIGKPKRLSIDESVYALSANVILVKPHECPDFIFLILNSDCVKKQVDLDVHSTSQPAFGMQKINRLLIPYPKKVERQMIVDSFNDIECLLETFDKEKAKMQLQRKGLLHDLLTGKVRIPETVNI